MIPAPLQNILDRLTVAWHERAIALKAPASRWSASSIRPSISAFFPSATITLDLPLIAANTLAWVVAVTGSYVMNSTITFAAESGRRLRVKSYFGFRGLAGRRLFRQYRTVWCLVDTLLVPAWAAKVAAILVSFVVNFSLSHFVVFRQRRPRATRIHRSRASDDAITTTI